MYEKLIQEMVEMSINAGVRPDYTQGGGGNTSVKLSEELMAVKASGYKLSDLTEHEGYVIINYKNVIDYFNNVDITQDKDFYKESGQFVKDNMIKREGLKEGRPSVEAGFHSFLNKYVIHTHSVYGNLLCCTKQGKDIAKELFEDSEFTYLWLPYISPGFYLTLEIKNSIERMGTIPDIIFMGSHGVIITANTKQKAEMINDYVGFRIKEKLGIKKDYGQVKVKQISDGVYESDTPELINLLKNTSYDDKWFDEYIMYPDQAAYLIGAISTQGKQRKAVIDKATGITGYRTSYKEALTLEESLYAVLFIMDTAKKAKLDTITMKPEDVAFIMGWEGEQYRKAMLSGK